jgi:hypothetical protein
MMGFSEFQTESRAMKEQFISYVSMMGWVSISSNIFLLRNHQSLSQRTTANRENESSSDLSIPKFEEKWRIILIQTEAFWLGMRETFKSHF